MKIKKLLVIFLITLTVLSSAVFTFGCSGTKGLEYELSEDESGYVVTGFSEEIEEYPEMLDELIFPYDENKIYPMQGLTLKYNFKLYH